MAFQDLDPNMSTPQAIDQPRHSHANEHQIYATSIVPPPPSSAGGSFRHQSPLPGVNNHIRHGATMLISNNINDPPPPPPSFPYRPPKEPNQPDAPTPHFPHHKTNSRPIELLCTTATTQTLDNNRKRHQQQQQRCQCQQCEAVVWVAKTSILFRCPECQGMSPTVNIYDSGAPNNMCQQEQVVVSKYA